MKLTIDGTNNNLDGALHDVDSGLQRATVLLGEVIEAC